MTDPHGSFARDHMLGAAAALGSALALGACFPLVPDAPPDGGTDSGVDAVTGDAYDAGGAGEASSPPSRECDFLVDPSSDAGGYTYPTITAAVAAARRSSCSTSPTVHVVAGTYTAPGETFPIEVRGVLLEGDGQDVTTVSGAGPVDEVVPPSNEVANLAMNLDVAGTFLVGADAAQTSISNLSIVGSSLAGYTTEGIVCDRGNGRAAPAATPNTTIDHVTVKGLNTAVRVTWSQVGPTAFSGCNALIIRSLLQDGWFGVIADGYGTDTSPVQLVSLRLGDSATDGNHLLNFHYSVTGAALNGAGLAISDAVIGSVMRGNTFSNQDFGIWIVQHDYDPTGGFDIEDNTVGPLVNNEGVGLAGNVAVAHFVNNTVQGVSMINQQAYGWLGVGLAIGLEDTQGIPYIAYARNNTFFGNDCGVEFRSSTDALPTGQTQHDDFGTAMDPGHNTFQCNSGWSGQTGGDVYMYMHKDATPPVIVPFEGNVWDHKPPTIVPSTSFATIPRGVDVFEYAVPAGDGGADDGGVPLQVVGGAVDTAGATVAPVTCPQNFVPGP